MKVDFGLCRGPNDEVRRRVSAPADARRAEKGMEGRAAGVEQYESGSPITRGS